MAAVVRVAEDREADARHADARGVRSAGFPSGVMLPLDRIPERYGDIAITFDLRDLPLCYRSLSRHGPRLRAGLMCEALSRCPDVARDVFADCDPVLSCPVPYGDSIATAAVRLV